MDSDNKGDRHERQRRWMRLCQPSKLRRGARNGMDFSGCKMAVAPTGEVFVTAQKEIWKVGLW